MSSVKTICGKGRQKQKAETHSIHFRLDSPIGFEMSPGYFEHTFQEDSLPNAPNPRQSDPQPIRHIQHAKQLRDDGFSYPEIAHELGVRVGTALSTW